MTTTTTAPSTIRKSRAKKIAVVAAGLLSIGIAVGVVTGASFTDSASVPGQSARAGTIEIDAYTEESSTPIAVDGLLPGDSAETSINLVNGGTGAVYYTVDLAVLDWDSSDPGLAGTLEATVTVANAGNVESVTRTLEEWQFGALQVAAPLNTDADAMITVDVELPYETGNDSQRDEVEFTVNIDAIQAKNTVAPSGGWIAD